MNKTGLAHIAAAIAALSAGAAVVATRFVIGETDPVPDKYFTFFFFQMVLVPPLTMR